MDIPKQYNPKDVEEKILRFWLDNDLFHTESSRGATSYCIVIPPPNITNILHLGQALNNVIQDILIRWKRMCGFNTLWMPGTDHAGIATQNVVEKELAREGLTREDLGRETFLERVWQWQDEYGGTIIKQLKRLGCSCDWVRERFTMDEGLSNAVQEVFIRLYEKGLIYRGNYIINWCPRCQTALSDEEAEHQEHEGKLYYIRYPIKNSDEFVVVATTRPETMLGDVAVALHPRDKRLKDMKKRVVILPILNRELKVIADNFVDPKFGTGIVKVTPAHDPNDFLMGQRHNLEPINVMNEDGTMNENAGPYNGLDRFVCRSKLLEDLDNQELIQKIEKHNFAVGHCYRCDTIVEPRLSLQWFVKMKPLAEPGIKAVKDNRIKFHPKRWTKVYLDWMENIRDWCISRQIWWGHQIPIWYCDECEEVIASKEKPERCIKCGSADLRQEEDVLDTWFSSWLWPFSTLDWPEENEELKFYYPTDTLVTASEIIFFWVARMIMAGFEFMNDIPFSDVLIHGTVRDDTGKKMSKSLGNIIDPLEIIDEFGADALRFSMIMITAQGQDVFISKEKFKIGRNFANKIWNASRFLLTNIEDLKEKDFDFESKKLSSDDIYILGKLNETIGNVTSALKKYRLNEAAASAYDFFWHHYCDRYIEYAKSYLYGDSNENKLRTQNVLLFVLENSLKLLHPLIPFITEAIWSKLPGGDKKPLIISPWPKLLKIALNPQVIRDTEAKYELIKAGRNLRKEYNIPPGKQLFFAIKPIDEKKLKFVAQEKENIVRMLRASEITIDSGFAPKKAMPSAITPLGTIYLSLEEAIDEKAEKERLKKELEKLETVLKRIKNKLHNQTFLEKAPKEVIEKEKIKLKELSEKVEKIQKNLSFLN